MRVGTISRGLVAGLAAALVLTGCGTRADESEVRNAAAGGGEVTINQETLDQLRETVAGATAPGAVDGGAAGPAIAAPGGPAAGPAPGTGLGAPATTGTVPARGPAAKPGATSSPAPGGTKATGAAGAACTTAGAPVTIGQVGTFSGLAGAVSGATRAATAIWAQDLNARGGLACHPVVLYARDDGGDPSRAASIVHELVDQRKVAALVASPVLFSIAGFRQAVEEEQIPVVGGDLIAPDWHESAWMFPQGASTYDQILGFVTQGVQAGKKRVGTLYCVELSICSEGIAWAKAGGADRSGGELVYDSAVSLTQTDFTAQCQNAKNAGVDQLLLGMDGSAMARVARSCATLGYRPLLSGFGGVVSPSQALDPNLRSFGLAAASSVVPWTETDTPGLQEYHAALARYSPGMKADGASVSAWTSGKLLEAAIAGVAAKARSGPITKAVVLEGLYTVRNESLGGLTAPLSFSPNQKKARSSGCVFYELLTPQGWTAPRGSRTVCL